MASIARHHFPRIAWRNGERLLWNPVQKKTFKNRPEERVRLRLIEALVAAGWSKNRISVEESIRARRSADNNIGRRTDIICYDRDFNPKILVECKAESVPISPKVAEQTARYNRSVEAPYLLMSNGLEDLWYHIRNANRKNIERLDGAPDLLGISGKHARREFDYWSERGFAGDKAVPDLREWLTGLLHSFWIESEGQIRFLSFENSPIDRILTHYFKIQSLEEGKIAVGFSDTPTGETRLIGVLNREQENIGMIAVHLDSVFANEKPNAVIFSGQDARQIDLREEFVRNMSGSSESTAAELPALLDRIFRQPD